MFLLRALLVATLLYLVFATGSESGDSESLKGDKEPLSKNLTLNASAPSPRTIVEWLDTTGPSLLNFIPNVNPSTPAPGSSAAAASAGVGSPGFFENLFSNSNVGLPGTVGTVTGSAVLVRQPKFKSLLKSLKKRKMAIKGGFITVLTVLKTIVIPAVLAILLIVFLVAGAAFFTCSLIDCPSAFGNFGGLRTRDSDVNPILGTPGTFLDDRNAIDYYEQFRPIYQAIDEGQKKYGGSSSKTHAILTSGQ